MQTRNDEIDLGELVRYLWQQKGSILGIAFLIGIAALVYVLVAKEVYRGEVLIEIGELILNPQENNDKPSMIQLIERPDDLKEAVLRTMVGIDERKEEKLRVESPKGSSRLLSISYEDHDKEVIAQKLDEAVKFVLKRHTEKSAFYEHNHGRIVATSVIGKSEITRDPVKPKKVFIVIVALVGGVMLGVLAALIRRPRTPEKHEEV
jgi:capsular polysaccharide biosynthesis protein